MATAKCPPTSQRYRALIVLTTGQFYQPTCPSTGTVKGYEDIEKAKCGAEEYIRKSLHVQQTPDVFILDMQEYKVVSHAVSPKKPMLDWK